MRDVWGFSDILVGDFCVGGVTFGLTNRGSYDTLAKKTTPEHIKNQTLLIAIDYQ